MKGLLDDLFGDGNGLEKRVDGLKNMTEDIRTLSEMTKDSMESYLKVSFLIKQVVCIVFDESMTDADKILQLRHLIGESREMFATGDDNDSC